MNSSIYVYWKILYLGVQHGSYKITMIEVAKGTVSQGRFQNILTEKDRSRLKTEMRQLLYFSGTPPT
jgi:hypothetical protein